MPDPNNFPEIIKTESMDSPIDGFHASKYVFNSFDSSFLSKNTYQNADNKSIYSVDSFLGHQFVEDPNRLLNYPNRSEKLGDLLYHTKLTLHHIAVIDIQQLKISVTSPEQAIQFKEMLASQGYDAIRMVDNENKYASNKLIKNTLIALTDESIQISTLTDVQTGETLQAKNGDFLAQIKQSHSNTSSEISKRPGDALQSRPMWSERTGDGYSVNIDNVISDARTSPREWQKTLKAIRHDYPQNVEYHDQLYEKLSSHHEQNSDVQEKLEALRDSIEKGRKNYLLQHSIEHNTGGGFKKALKAAFALLPVAGSIFTIAEAAEQIDAINNSDLSTEAKAAAHAFNLGMTIDAIIDPTMAAGMAGQEAAKAALIVQYGEEISPFLVQTDGEALAEAAGKERFASAQAIIDTLPKDPAVLKEMATNKNLSADVRHLAEGQMMVQENYFSVTPTGMEAALTGKSLLDKTAQAMYEKQEKSDTHIAHESPAKEPTAMDKACTAAAAAGCTASYVYKEADAQQKPAPPVGEKASPIRQV